MKYIIALIVSFVIGTLLSLGVTCALQYTYDAFLIGTLGIALPKLAFWQMFGLVMFITTIKEVVSPTKADKNKSEDEDTDPIYGAMATVITMSLQRLMIIAMVFVQTWIWIQILG